MSQPVRTVHPQTPLADAAHLMVTERISGLPVVDDAGALVGIITEADFLRSGSRHISRTTIYGRPWNPCSATSHNTAHWRHQMRRSRSIW